MDLSKWYIAMFIVIFISFFVAMLGVLTGENVVGYEIKILYRSVNLFMITIRFVLEVIVVVASMLAIVISSLGLGVFNWLFGTDFKPQIFYNMQTQFLVGIEGIYTEVMDWFYDVSVINESVFQIEIAFTPQEEFLEAVGDVGDSLIAIWNGSFGAVINNVLAGLGNLADGIEQIWDDIFPISISRRWF